jgi:hypothetical protein
MVSPIVAGLGEACLFTSILGLKLNVTDSLAVSMTGEPTGGWPVAVAVLAIGPGRSDSWTV